MSIVIENPLLNTKSTITVYDERLSTNVEIEQTNVAKYFKHVYVLVKKNNDPIDTSFYDWQVKSDIFDQISQNLIIHKCTVKLLKTKVHFDNMICLSAEQLNRYNMFNYQLDDKNIVVPILNVSYQNILPYLTQYDSPNTLQNIYKLKVLNSYFGVSENNHSANKLLSNYIESLDDADYWTQSYNCLSNLTPHFKKRNFNFDSNRITDKTTAQIVSTIFTKDITTLKNDKKDYIKDIGRKDNIVDLSSVIQNKGFKLYQVAQPSEFTNQEIVELFKTLNPKQQYSLFTNLLCSQKYCHHAINNSELLDMMKQTINDHAHLFRYLITYAWIRFYFEECIKKSYVKTTDDFIFDINTASKLPIYPFDHTQPKLNPYMPILVSDNELNPIHNVNGIQEHKHRGIQEHKDKFINKGICTLDEFKVRMNIFCTGNPNNDLFEGYNFVKSNVAITGSIMTACLQKHHPLMDIFTGCDTLTQKFTAYFNEFYSQSDIDIMFKTKCTLDFIDKVNDFHNLVTYNIIRFNTSYAKPEHVALVLNKVSYIFVDEEFIETLECPEYVKNKIQWVKDNITTDEVKSLFRPCYDKAFENYVNKYICDLNPEEVNMFKKKYPDIFVKNDDFNIYIKKINKNKFTKEQPNQTDNESDDEEDVDEPQDNSDKINIAITYKYKITSPHLTHSLELFSIKYDDFFGVVSRFHLPCVRAYYNESNVYMTPSCISAHLTYMNIDYKYICGTKDPIDIINKNRMRGFGTYLNPQEKKLFAIYSREIPFWKNLYNLDSSLNDTDTLNRVGGVLSYNHKIFNPRHYNMDYFLNDMYVDTTNRYITNQIPVLKSTDFQTINEIFGTYSYPVNACAINKNGNINPLDKTFISMSWTQKHQFNNHAETSSDNTKKAN